MSDVLRDLLGIDPEELEWQDFALCRGDDTNDHYDNYEADPTIARIIDEKCLSCPVLAQCLEYGTDNNEWGVWGGIYLTSGKPDMNRNTHKTKETWDAIRGRISGKSVL